ncbi:C2 domain-containing protein [Chlamydoabsidia padenii]|nr:C2 domain-containing protein [Chlamydoabsidia padenii]
MAQVKYIGELAVVALKAVVGKQDPFCVFRLGEEAKKTKTDYRGGQHPVWDDQVNLMVPEGKVKMRVQLFDEDAKREDLISETDLDITTVIKEGEQDGWFPLSYKGRKAGEIYLELTFYAAVSLLYKKCTRN